MDEALKSMGQKIYQARKAAKMSRAALGELVGLHETTVKRYEDGDIKSPNLTNLRAFANALKMDYHDLVDELIGGDSILENEEFAIVFKSFETYQKWASIMDKFDYLNEAGRNIALDYLDVLISHPQYSNKK